MTMKISTRVFGIAVASCLALSTSGCGGGGGSSAAAGGTVNVDVGTSKPVKLPKKKLRIGVFMNTMSNSWQKNFSDSAVAAGKAAGDQVTVVDANFDVAAQKNQLQNAVASKKFDAIILVPVDGQQVCQLMTKTLPQANILTVAVAGPICGLNTSKTLEGLWAPGTLAFVGGDATLAYQTAWARIAAKRNPGPQNVALVTGPQLGPFTAVQSQALKEFSASDPDFKLKGILYTDYTSPSGYSATVNYLRAHPDTTVLMSVYSPDLTRGIVKALDAVGKAGKVTVADLGGSEYSLQQIKAGTVQFTLPYTPKTQGKNAVQAILDAQAGKKPQRFVSEFGAGQGTPNDPLVISKDNASSFSPEF